jgi:uncharacterized Zn-binding protein involved in type VI secretion
MPPAARTTDLHVCIVHPPIPLPIGKASTDVFVGFLPAARLTDRTVCPAQGPIVTGSPNVFIDYQPAARLGDLVAPPGVIVTGCPTVMIGSTPQVDALMAAAALGLPFCEECAEGGLSEPAEGDGSQASAWSEST